jgi:hypothetical protein
MLQLSSAEPPAATQLAKGVRKIGDSLASQRTVSAGGHVSVGGIVSFITMSCAQVATFPHESAI